MREKHVLREAVKDVVIDPVYNREKHPFTTPPATSNDDPMYIFARDVLSPEALADQRSMTQRRRWLPRRTWPILDAVERSKADAVMQRMLSTTMLSQRFCLSEIV